MAFCKNNHHFLFLQVTMSVCTVSSSMRAEALNISALQHRRSHTVDEELQVRELLETTGPNLWLAHSLGSGVQTGGHVGEWITPAVCDYQQDALTPHPLTTPKSGVWNHLRRRSLFCISLPGVAFVSCLLSVSLVAAAHFLFLVLWVSWKL